MLHIQLCLAVAFDLSQPLLRGVKVIHAKMDIERTHNVITNEWTSPLHTVVRKALTLLYEENAGVEIGPPKENLEDNPVSRSCEQLEEVVVWPFVTRQWLRRWPIHPTTNGHCSR